MSINLKQLHFESDKILSSLSTKDKTYFLSFTKRLVFKKGKLIFYEGGIPTGVFLINQGKAKIYKTGLDGKDQIFYIYKQGDLFGYHALLCNENYEDSCEALEDCEILFINRSDFEILLHSISNLKLLLIQNMSHEFGVLVNTITILAQMPLRERLALYLLILHDRYSENGNQETSINLPREDLANIIGTTRESLGRILKDFKDDQLIKVTGRSIQILDSEQLSAVCNM